MPADSALPVARQVYPDRPAIGYRVFSSDHLDLTRLARAPLHHHYPCGKEPVLGLVARAVAGDLEGALELARGYLDQGRFERNQAEAAAHLLQGWAEGDCPTSTVRPLRIRETAKLLGITTDAPRDRECNGLIEVPKAPRNRYRLYGLAQVNWLSPLTEQEQRAAEVISQLEQVVCKRRG